MNELVNGKPKKQFFLHDVLNAMLTAGGRVQFSALFLVDAATVRSKKESKRMATTTTKKNKKQQKDHRTSNFQQILRCIYPLNVCINSLTLSKNGNSQQGFKIYLWSGT